MADFYRINNGFNSPSLLSSSLARQQQGKQQMLNSLVGGLNDLSSNEELKEKDNYNKFLQSQLLNNYATIGSGLNQRIDPLRIKNGQNINDINNQYSGYINPDVKQKLFDMVNQRRLLDANIENQSLMARNKSLLGQQTADVQSYINSVGDANKDGYVDVNDLNPTERAGLLQSGSMMPEMQSSLLTSVNKNQQANLLYKKQNLDKEKTWLDHNNIKYKQQTDLLKLKDKINNINFHNQTEAQTQSNVKEIQEYANAYPNLYKKWVSQHGEPKTNKDWLSFGIGIKGAIAMAKIKATKTNSNSLYEDIVSSDELKKTAKTLGLSESVVGKLSPTKVASQLEKNYTKEKSFNLKISKDKAGLATFLNDSQSKWGRGFDAKQSIPAGYSIPSNMLNYDIEREFNTEVINYLAKHNASSFYRLKALIDNGSIDNYTDNNDVQGFIQKTLAGDKKLRDYLISKKLLEKD